MKKCELCEKEVKKVLRVGIDNKVKTICYKCGKKRKLVIN